MSFNVKRNRIKELLKECGIVEVANSKAFIPSQFPAGIVSLQRRRGVTPTSDGYADHKYKFEVVLVVEDSENADVKILDLIAGMENKLDDEQFFTMIENVDFYDSWLDTGDLRLASFELEV